MGVVHLAEYILFCTEMNCLFCILAFFVVYLVAVPDCCLTGTAKIITSFRGDRELRGCF